MPDIDKRDLLIHYDESSGELIFYTVASDEMVEIRNREFDGARTETQWFLDKEPSEAEKDLGSMIFSLVDAFSKKKIGIRDYKSLNDAAHKKYVAELEVESDQGSAEAKYFLFIEYHSRALKESDLELLNRAEELLNAASGLEYYEASNRLNGDWPLIKGAALRKINRGKKS